jgi:hypothetical protein
MNRFYFAPRPRGCLRPGALALLLGLTGSAIAAPTPTSAYGQLPLSFEPNQGQTAPEVRFLSRGPGYQLFITPQEAVLTLHKSVPKAEAGKATPTRPTPTESAVVRMHLDGANPNVSMAGQSPLPGKVNYLRGNDPKQWRTDIPTYEKVKYTHVYPGIDLVYYGRERQLEYDFIVAPGADPKAIALSFSGGKLQLTEAGDLVLTTATGDVRFQKPVLYQEIQGRKQPVAGRYTRQGAEHIGFEVGAYDATRPLVIDPVLSYSTYLGGSDWDGGNGIAVDTRGQVYVTGWASSDDFPTTPKALQRVRSGGLDAFVVKLNAAGTALIYSTYLGGSSQDEAKGIAVDTRGQIYVTGSTSSNDFPTTPNTLQPVFGSTPVSEHWTPSDAFVAKLSAAGNTLLYSTYLGGSSQDEAKGIAVDTRGQVHVAGWTYSDDFPVTPQALQPVLNSAPTELSPMPDAFIAKLNPTGSALVYSTYLGGSTNEVGNDIAVDSRGQVYVTGVTESEDFPTTPKALQPAHKGGDLDAFVAKFNVTGTALVYSTYLGGGHRDEANGIAVDTHGQVYVTGRTESEDFPVTPQALQPVPGSDSFYSDAFVAKLNAAGDALVYGTYLGGSRWDNGRAIAVDLRGRASIVGETDSEDFPTRKALQPSRIEPDQFGFVPPDAFMAQLNATGTELVYSTYFGGSGWDSGYGVAVDSYGKTYVVGHTDSEDFPTTRNALQPGLGGFWDAFVVKINDSRHRPRRK